MLFLKYMHVSLQYNIYFLEKLFASYIRQSTGESINDNNTLNDPYTPASNSHKCVKLGGCIGQ